MEAYKGILDKLHGFVTKYYRVRLLKGVIWFGLLFLLLWLVLSFLESWLWASSTVRLVFLSAFVIGGVFLFARFIIMPALYLFKWRKGIDLEEAARIVGQHFPKISDGLLNFVQFVNAPHKSELLAASIKQRSEHLAPFRFTKAISTKSYLGRLRYAWIMFAVLLLLGLIGVLRPLFDGYTRIANYDMAYAPPAPFDFVLLNENLQVLDDSELELRLNLQGKAQPEDVYINWNGSQNLMDANQGIFQYTLRLPLQSGTFYFEANGFRSKVYSLEVLQTPTIGKLRVKIGYPKYLNRTEESLQNTGNFSVPEGSTISWSVNGVASDSLHFLQDSLRLPFAFENHSFVRSETVFESYDYAIESSNGHIQGYEKLDYSLEVVKDGYPTIQVSQQIDSMALNEAYYEGQVSDDYGIETVLLRYREFQSGKPFSKLDLVNGLGTVGTFYYTFPSGIAFEAGKDYEYFFEVVDNDGIRGGKASKSNVFVYGVKTDKELINNNIDKQGQLLEQWDQLQDQWQDKNQMLDQLLDEQRQERELDYIKREAVNQALDQLQSKEKLLEKLSYQLKELLNEVEQKEVTDELLKERLSRQEAEAKKNQELLKQLDSLTQKMSKEELGRELEQLGKEQQKRSRGLEQLLELTKKFYVAEKANLIIRDLEELSHRQDSLAITNREGSQGQEQLNRDFKNVQRDLNELDRMNQGMRKPMPLDTGKNLQKAIEQHQEAATKEINKGTETNKASQQQKQAAQKMKKLAQQMTSDQQKGSGGGGPAEDAEMLRRVLENLIIISDRQEGLIDLYSEYNENGLQLSSTIKNQKELQGLFRHVDDSLFVLSLRQPMISEVINNEISEVNYNFDKSLQYFADNQLYQAGASQQRVLTSLNTMADFLANSLDNMQESMSKSGEGEGSPKGFQLPDIISSQEELQKKMEQLMQEQDQSGKEGQQNKSEGQEGQQGQDGKQGQKGQQGKKGHEGQQSQQGQQGQQGQAGQRGEQGQAGQRGEQGQQGQQGQQGEEGQQGQHGRQGQQGQQVQQGQQGQQGQPGQQGQNGKGNGQGHQSGKLQSGKNKAPLGYGDSEESLEELYEIYKEQGRIRKQLEDQLDNMIRTSDKNAAKALIRQMEQTEEQLLNEGINRNSTTKVSRIKNQMLRFKDAALQQDKKNERKGTTNNKDYSNPIITKPKSMEDTERIETLNKKVLPLQRFYKGKVKAYFKDDTLSPSN